MPGASSQPTPRSARARPRPPSSIRARSAWLFTLPALLIPALYYLDGPSSALCLLLITLSAWQGFRIGAIEICLFLFATLLALLVAPPLGRAIEPGIAALSGLTGLLSRAASFAIILLSIIATLGLGGRAILRASIPPGSPWRARNAAAGAALGALEGLLLWLGLVWILLALQPVAQARLAPRHADASPRARHTLDREPLAAAITSIAASIQSTRLGSLAQDINPVPGLRILMLAESFSAVSRDDYAMRWFLDSKVMRDIRALPSYNRAVTLASGDSRLTGFFSEQGVESGLLLELTRNPTILEILDTTTLAADLDPLTDRLEQTIHDARARIAQGRPEDIDIE